MSAHEHHYAKLNDEAVFCRGCGDIKTVPPVVCTRLHQYTPTYIWTTTPVAPALPYWTITNGSAFSSGDL